MIFLKKLFRRAAVSERRSGQMSIWLALGFSVFLALLSGVPGIGQNAVCEKTGGAGRGERTVLPVF